MQNKTLLCFNSGLVIGILLGASCGIEWAARASERTLRDLHSSFESERDDWRRTDRALTDTAIAQHAALDRCQAHALDAADAADNVRIAGQWYLQADQKATTPAVQQDSPAPAAAAQPDSIFAAVVKFLLSR